MFYHFLDPENQMRAIAVDSKASKGKNDLSKENIVLDKLAQCTKTHLSMLLLHVYIKPSLNAVFCGLCYSN